MCIILDSVSESLHTIGLSFLNLVSVITVFVIAVYRAKNSR